MKVTKMITQSGALVMAAALFATMGAMSPAQASADPAEPNLPETATAQEAAVTCNGWIYGNYDDGTGEVSRAGNMKVGPYAECGNVTYTTVGTDLYYWCYAINGYGHTWTYARIAGTSKQGWLSDDNLNNGGSTRSCNGVGGPKLPASLMNTR